MKVDFANQTINVEIETEIVEACLKGEDKLRISKLVQQAFQKSYPHMKKMDPTFFDQIAGDLVSNPSNTVSVTSLKFQKKLKTYHRKQLVKLRTAHNSE